MEYINSVLYGDCRDKLKQLKEAGVFVQTCITSPPYFGLRDYGHKGQIGNEDTPEQFVKNLVEVFRGVWNVLADDGTVWLNLGDSYYNYRPGKGQSLPSQTVNNSNQDLPTTCGRRGNKLEGLKEKDLIGIPWRVAFALQADGWYLRQDIIWNKPNCMPESVNDRCTKSHEYIFLLSKNKKYYFDNQIIKEKAVDGDPASPRGSMGVGEKLNSGRRETQVEKEVLDTRNKRSVWTVPVSSYKGSHFATFPPDLITPCILAGCPVGGVVLDPFLGSGTTGEVAQVLGRNYIGIELNQKYEKLQKSRLAQRGLFS